VDDFKLTEESQRGAVGGRDYASVEEATHRLLTDAATRLRALNPDVLLEFRQRYIGPAMRSVGNEFRSNDCPADAVQNRMQTVDIRLLAGETAVHSDPLMWHPEDPVESAARQLLNVLFSVPQLSVDGDALPRAHHQMLQFWMKFREENADVLLHGELRADNPEENYPVVRSQGADKEVIAVYSDRAVRLGEAPPRTVHVVNGSASGSLMLGVEAEEIRRLRVFDVLGKCLRDEEVRLSPGAFELALPPSGLATLERTERP
jgi:alpha-galactosidase